MSRVPLDENTRRTLDASLAMDALKLFAVMALADNMVSEEEKDYIRCFYGHFYPDNITEYFYERFEGFLAANMTVDDVAPELNHKLSYQDKIFCLLKAYELILADTVEEEEVVVAHHLARALDILPEDRDFLEAVVGIADYSETEKTTSSIIGIRVGGDKLGSDVYLPAFPGLDLILFKVRNFTFVMQRDRNHKVMVAGHRLRTGITSRVPHNAAVELKGMDVTYRDSISMRLDAAFGEEKTQSYDITYQDLRLYFENKKNPPLGKLYIATDCDPFAFSLDKRDDSGLEVVVRGSTMEIRPLAQDTTTLLNEEKVNGSVYANLHDLVYINDRRLLPRDVFTYLEDRKQITLPRDKAVLTMANGPRADIYLPDELSERWEIEMALTKSGLVVSPADCPYQVYLNHKPLHGSATLTQGDILFVSNTFLTFDLEQGVVAKRPFNFKKVIAETIRYRFSDGHLGLDDVTFDIDTGDMVCIMGPSGCGKSTLLNIISGLNDPLEGNVSLDTHDLHREYPIMKDYLGYVPQDDLLLPNLTVYENLYYYAKLRFPYKTKEELSAQIEIVLKDIGLAAKQDTRVGHPVDKKLSGGERKRLNIGMELLVNAEVFLLDEPTSGLSSKDSEKILELLANISLRGKIVLCVIHQPSSKLYKKFNKLILLDKGGKMAFFGDTFDALHYFKAHMEGVASDEEVQVECPHCKAVQPELLLDSLEEALRDIDGAVLGERKYSPAYWKDLYARIAATATCGSSASLDSDDLPPTQPLTMVERFKQFATLFSRNMKNKTRDRSNLLITFLEAPLLGAGVGFVLKYTPTSEPYILLENKIFKVYLFIAVIVSVFLAMTNSADEIIGDAALFLRERMLNVKKTSYLAAKLLVLIPFALIQNALFIVLGFFFLEVRELHLQYVLFLTLVSIVGLSIGLFVSSLPKISSKAAQNLIPLILVPQIILGGALIAYEDMNRQFTFFENNPVPEICQFMPSRWAYEGLMVLQGVFNSYHEQEQELLEAKNDFKRNKDKIIEVHGEDYYNTERARLEEELEAYRAEYQIYGNYEINQALESADAMAEEDSESYPMFIREKTVPFTGVVLSTVIYNALVLLGMIVLLNLTTLAMLANRERILLGLGKSLRMFRRR
ncbi:MAG: ATP-binding cassette domain-containing protein [Desulfovibrio sp.]|nr:MAG: ATP-binding cassette domain-containing protein [Desulfovibrio sp.]